MSEIDLKGIIQLDKVLIEKDKEIERLNNELQIQIEDNVRLNEYIEEQDNIIKEVREYIESNYFYTLQGMKKANETIFGVKLLEILDKENK